ncbi:hypothetical protein [Burkholderia sp. BCC1981]|nr:hypothetical protein [Burkholderia sp. BCC1981]
MKAAQEAIAEAAINGSKASAGAINSFVQSTARMADTVGKTRSQLLEMKAAQRSSLNLRTNRSST